MKQKMFDRKLVLFCLAISDIVLINTKGNLDQNTKDILLSCLDSLFSSFSEGEDICNIFLCYNQNQTTNLTKMKA